MRNQVAGKLSECRGGPQLAFNKLCEFFKPSLHFYKVFYIPNSRFSIEESVVLNVERDLCPLPAEGTSSSAGRGHTMLVVKQCYLY